jgi:hypothetical protein
VSSRRLADESLNGIASARFVTPCLQPLPTPQFLVQVDAEVYQPRRHFAIQGVTFLNIVDFLDRAEDEAA